MHKRPHKKDKDATKAAKFESRYSYVSLRIHPGTTHPCVYLAGDDCGPAREAIFERDGYKCQVCGKSVPLDGFVTVRGHLAHGGNTKISRCWCPENLTLKCFHDHMIVEHDRETRFGERAA